jgi:flagellar assembly protein FliH
MWDLLPTFNSPNQSAKGNGHEQIVTEGEIPMLNVVVADAEEKASRIIADAKADAERIRHEASLEAEGMQDEAQSRGYEAGWQQAKIEVEEQLNASWDDRLEALRSDIKAVIAAIEAERGGLWKQTEKEIVTFAIEMAQKIVKTEVQQNPKVIAEVIKHALRRVVSKEHIRIRISPQDIDAVRSQREDLLLVLDGAANLEIIDDRRVQQGGCVIETTAGNIDSNIETQVARISSALEVE